MPRPKRTRAVASRNAIEEPTASAQAAHNPIQSSSDIYDLSDREKERISRRKSVFGAEAEETQGERPRLAQLESRHANSLEQSLLREDASRDKPHTVLSTSRTMGAPSDDVESPPELGRRSERSARRTRHTDVSGLDLDDDTFGDLDDSLVDGEESQTGQRSTDTSSINVAAFRRRPRLSSTAGKDDGPVRPSSRGPTTPGITSTFSFGNFKRRPREPSILGTARKHRSRSRQPMASGDDSSNEQDFTRLDDSTPPRRAARGSSAVGSRAVSRDHSRQRETRKRKSLEDHGGGGKRIAIESDHDIHDPIEVEDAEYVSSPPTTPVRATTAGPNDPDLAPPASVSSDDSLVVRANLETLTHRHYRTRRPASRAHRTPEPDADASDLSSPPSLTHSPNYSPPPKQAPRGRARKRDPPAKLTTADLSSLLPRRRYKQANTDPFNISSDAEDDTLALDDEDDELSYAHPKRTKRRVRPLTSASNSATKGKRPAPGKRTYGSRVSDKENDEGDSVVGRGDGEDAAADDEQAVPDEETTQMMLARLGDELKNAAKKFKEVDKWQLDFEEVTEPSSPGNAR